MGHNPANCDSLGDVDSKLFIRPSLIPKLTNYTNSSSTVNESWGTAWEAIASPRCKISTCP